MLGHECFGQLGEIRQAIGTAQNQPNERGLGAGRHPLGAVAHRGNGLQDRFALVRRNIPTAVHHAGDRRYRYSRRRGDVFHGYFFMALPHQRKILYKQYNTRKNVKKDVN